MLAKKWYLPSHHCLTLPCTDQPSPKSLLSLERWHTTSYHMRWNLLGYFIIWPDIINTAAEPLITWILTYLLVLKMHLLTIVSSSSWMLSTWQLSDGELRIVLNLPASMTHYFLKAWKNLPCIVDNEYYITCKDNLGLYDLGHWVSFSFAETYPYCLIILLLKHKKNNKYF